MLDCCRRGSPRLRRGFSRGLWRWLAFWRRDGLARGIVSELLGALFGGGPIGGGYVDDNVE